MSEILRVIDEPATGFAGTIVVSGLPQREDHCLVVEAIAASLRRDIADISLSQGLNSRPEYLRYPYRTSLEKRKSVPLPDLF